jgi:two-component system sensor histidine kinase KdpD
VRYDAGVTAGEDIRKLTIGCAGIVLVTFVFGRWPQFSNATTVALGFLVVVLLVAATSRLWVAVTTSVVAMLAFNFFFLPPVGAFVIADPQNWVALFAFLAVSLVASNLSAVARARTHEAVTRRDEVGRLFDLSRDVLLITESQTANSSLAGFIARRFDLDYVAICLPRGSEWLTFESGGTGAGRVSPAALSAAFRAAGGYGLDSTPGPTTPSTARRAGRNLQIVPIRLGTKTRGLLAAAGRPIEPGTLDALAGLVAIAIERVQFLDERKSADLARQSEELKSALLASLGHDLRTPLTAIRVAADNLQSLWPDERERREQGELIVTEVDRLTHLFQNILEMARIDAGAVTRDARWVAPSEIVDAARSRVEPALRGRTVDVAADSERLVRLDPRLSAAALSHLLENAVRHSPNPSTIHVGAAVTDAGLTITVRDHGSGISAADLPLVFDRFYRGADAKKDPAGTGMGLAIARGLLAVEGGRISVENCVDGGARFTIVVPADVK